MDPAFHQSVQVPREAEAKLDVGVEIGADLSQPRVFIQDDLRGGLRLLGHRINFSRRKRSREAPCRPQAAARDRILLPYFLDAIRAGFVRDAEFFIQSHSIIVGRQSAKATR